MSGPDAQPGPHRASANTRFTDTTLESAVPSGTKVTGMPCQRPRTGHDFTARNYLTWLKTAGKRAARAYGAGRAGAEVPSARGRAASPGKAL
jgi:hypothetical protein